MTSVQPLRRSLTACAILPAFAAPSRQNLRVGRVSLQAAGLNRDRIVHLADGRRQDDFGYALVLPLRAAISFKQGDLSGSLEVGEYLLLSQSNFYELSSTEDLLHWCICMPASDLRARIVSIDDHVGRRFVQNRLMAQLVRGIVEAVVETFAEARPPNAEALATEIIDFVALAIAAEDRSTVAGYSSARYHLKRRVIDYIGAHLGDGDLTPRKIACENRLSLSYLHSLFSDNYTTVSRYVQQRRLQWAYELLVGSASEALSVSEVAYRVGFKNPSHFSRTFRSHFLHAPTDARRVTQACSVPV